MRWSFPVSFALFTSATMYAQPPDLPPPPPRPPAYAPDHLGDPSAARQFKDLVPSLIDALKDTDAEVRQHAAMALAAVGPEAIKPLSDALKDPVKEKRAAAAYALGQMGALSRDAMPVLLTALKDEESAVRRSASQAISRILSADTLSYGRAMSGATMYPGRPLGPPPLSRPDMRPTEVPEPPKKSEPKPEKKEPDKTDSGK
jgi:hypothetical protein